MPPGRSRNRLDAQPGVVSILVVVDHAPRDCNTGAPDKSGRVSILVVVDHAPRADEALIDQQLAVVFQSLL